MNIPEFHKVHAPKNDDGVPFLSQQPISISPGIKGSLIRLGGSTCKPLYAGGRTRFRGQRWMLIAGDWYLLPLDHKGDTGTTGRVWEASSCGWLDVERLSQTTNHMKNRHLPGAQDFKSSHKGGYHCTISYHQKGMPGVVVRAVSLSHHRGFEAVSPYFYGERLASVYLFPRPH